MFRGDIGYCSYAKRDSRNTKLVNSMRRNLKNEGVTSSIHALAKKCKELVRTERCFVTSIFDPFLPNPKGDCSSTQNFFPHIGQDLACKFYSRRFPIGSCNADTGLRKGFFWMKKRNTTKIPKACHFVLKPVVESSNRESWVNNPLQKSDDPKYV